MLLNPTPDQLLFQQTTATFLDELVPPAVLRQLRDDPTGEPDGYWARGADLGWISPLVREEDGGGAIGEHGLVDLTLIAYEFGRHAAPGPIGPTNIVAALLSQRGGRYELVEEGRRRLLEQPLIRGRVEQHVSLLRL